MEINLAESASLLIQLVGGLSIHLLLNAAAFTPKFVKETPNQQKALLVDHISIAAPQMFGHARKV
jgi:hypothetical protein